jgi:hypothetical protein
MRSNAAIRLRDKLLLILSEHSIKSDWVETEVTTAFEEELKRGQTVLFPIRLDDAVMDTKEAWAAKLRAPHWRLSILERSRRVQEELRPCGARSHDRSVEALTPPCASSVRSA